MSEGKTDSDFSSVRQLQIAFSGGGWICRLCVSNIDFNIMNLLTSRCYFPLTIKGVSDKLTSLFNLHFAIRTTHIHTDLATSHCLLWICHNALKNVAFFFEMCQSKLHSVVLSVRFHSLSFLSLIRSAIKRRDCFAESV